MKLIVCKNEAGWVAAIDQWFQENLHLTRARRVFLPAGETPKPLYAFWREQKPDYLKPLTFVQLDEVTSVQVHESPSGEVSDKKNVFRQFFVEQLGAFVAQFEFIDTAEKGADLAVLGLGTNGHVAFHEPGISRGFFSGCVQLDNETRKRLGLGAAARGTTYGVEAFMRAQAVLMIVRGASKKEILKKILSPSCDLPAAWVARHTHVTIICDFEI